MERRMNLLESMISSCMHIILFVPVSFLNNFILDIIHILLLYFYYALVLLGTRTSYPSTCANFVMCWIYLLQVITSVLFFWRGISVLLFVYVFILFWYARVELTLPSLFLTLFHLIFVRHWMCVRSLWFIMIF